MLLVFLTCYTTLFSILTLDKTQKARIFALWFFHNSIRFKVNKVWLGLVVRQALIVYRGFVLISLFPHSKDKTGKLTNYPAK